MNFYSPLIQRSRISIFVYFLIAKQFQLIVTFTCMSNPTKVRITHYCKINYVNQIEKMRDSNRKFMLNAKSTRCKRLTQTFPAGVLTVFYVDIRFERVVFDNDVLYGVRIAVDDQVSPEDTCGYLQLR